MKRIFTLLCIALFLSSCTVLPQKRVRISAHSQTQADMYNLSYPATLRSASISMGFDPALNTGVLQEINHLKESLEQDKLALSKLSLLNEPEIIGLRYEELMNSIINLQVKGIAPPLEKPATANSEVSFTPVMNANDEAAKNSEND